MKVEMEEFDKYFSLSLTPETIQEAALLVRFGLNATKELKARWANAGQKEIKAYIEIGRAHRAEIFIKRTVKS